MKTFIILSLMSYFIASISFWINLFTKKKTGKTLGFSFFGIGFLIQIFYLVVVSIKNGTIPIVHQEDILFLLSTILAMIFYGLTLYKKQLKDFGAVYSPIIVFLIALSLPNYSQNIEPYNNIWFYLHVFFAMLSYALIIALVMVSSIYILTERDLKNKKLNSIFVSKFSSSLKTLQDLEDKILVLVFISVSLALIFSSIWSSVYLGKHWIWDPKQVFLSILWIFYGGIIHFRIVRHEKGREVSYLTIGISILALIVYWFIKHPTY